MDENERREALRFLIVQTIGDISEEEWRAGWMINIEYSIWAELTPGRTYPPRCSRTPLSATERSALIMLRDQLGEWPMYIGEAGVDYVWFSLAEFEAHFVDMGGGRLSS